MAADATIVGVVGAGAMGAGIAQVAAVAGHPVRIFDVRPGAAALALESIGSMMEKLRSKGRLTETQAEAARTSVSVADSLADLGDCGLIVEAIVEDLAAKRGLFAALEAIVDDDAILATNTSSISVTAIGSVLRNPARLAGMHFFNPAPLLPLVEIVSGVATSTETASYLAGMAVAWGKTPVQARSTPGFIVNRVARPFYAEALRALSEGAADCATIDAILRDAGGFRMGPFALMDLIGNDVNSAVTRSVYEGFYGDPRFTPSVLQGELVAAGFLGRKTGRGFFVYGDAPVKNFPFSCPPYPLPLAIKLFGKDALVNALARRLAGASVLFEHTESVADERLAECDGCVLFRSDGRTATARAAASGLASTVLVDLALDAASATRLAIAAADQSAPSAVEAAAGLLQAAGYEVSAIDDLPGMIVLRAVAMLVNEAADAVHQGVCSAADCDLAMRLGVNYPRGPLAWGDALGSAFVVRVLDNLAAAYGRDRYRVSPLLMRRALANMPLLPERKAPR